MKKNLPTLRLTLAAIFMAAATVSFAQVQVGIKAGPSYYNMNIIDGQKYDVKTQGNPGFHAGVFFDIPISEKIFFQPSVLFATKGYRSNQTGYVINSADTTYFKATFIANPYFIDIPLNFVYKQNAGNNTFVLGAGPYVSYGMGGNWKYNMPQAYKSLFITKGPLQFLEDYQTKSDSLDVRGYSRKLDFGVSGVLGYEIGNRYIIHLGGQFGLLNLEPFYKGVRPVWGSQTTYGLSLSLGYKF